MRGYPLTFKFHFFSLRLALIEAPKALRYRACSRFSESSMPSCSQELAEGSRGEGGNGRARLGTTKELKGTDFGIVGPRPNIFTALHLQLRHAQNCDRGAERKHSS